MNQKGFINIAIIIGIVVVVGIAGYFVMKQSTILPQPSQETPIKQTSQENTENISPQTTTGVKPTPSNNTQPSSKKPAQVTKEDIRSCVSASNYTYEFYVVFSANTSKQDAEKILRDENVETFHLTSEPPSGYSFELPNQNMCVSLEGIFKMKDTFKIPALYRQPEEGQPTNGPVNSLSCPNVPSYFVTPNGYISSPSNNFVLTYYQNGDQLKEALESVGAYNIVAIGDKKKTYYATFQNGKICASVNALKTHPSIVEIDTVPYLPGPPTP